MRTAVVIVGFCAFCVGLHCFVRWAHQRHCEWSETGRCDWVWCEHYE